MRNKYKRSAFFDMSDDRFYQISLIGFLVIFPAGMNCRWDIIKQFESVIDLEINKTFWNI